jgi:hypothetical protein
VNARRREFLEALEETDRLRAEIRAVVHERDEARSRLRACKREAGLGLARLLEVELELERTRATLRTFDPARSDETELELELDPFDVRVVFGPELDDIASELRSTVARCPVVGSAPYRVQRLADELENLDGEDPLGYDVRRILTASLWLIPDAAPTRERELLEWSAAILRRVSTGTRWDGRTVDELAGRLEELAR